MTLYDFVKWLHILSSTVLFGTGLGTAFHLWVSHRRGSPNQIALAARNTVLADWLFTLPSGVVQPLTGFWMIWLAGWDVWASWLVASYALFVLALGCWLPVVAIQIKAHRLAQAADRTDTNLPDRFYRLMRYWFWLGWPAFIGLIAIFALMVAKPVLW
ncbi:MAG: DUF2269 domain-containing protein [Pseudomonadota bacterium]